MKHPVIALTMGDPGGIGPEIILKSLRKIKRKSQFVIIGSREVFEYTSKRLKLPFRGIHFIDITKEAMKLASPKKFSVGSVSKWNSALAYASLKKAAEMAKRKQIKGLVTAPINKTAMRLIDPKFLGHTEFLAKSAGAKEYAMMFYSKKLIVTLATIHLPLKEVSKALKPKEILSKISLTDEFLKKRLCIRNPKIGVSALNPHGNEFGREEERVISPAVKIAKRKGIFAVGPLPGDQIFHEAYEGRLDAVVAMYHDQALAPFKMIAFREGVNLTLGLPFVRTSPDHGTAFEIAYQNKADYLAFLNSIRLIEKLLG